MSLSTAAPEAPQSTPARHSSDSAARDTLSTAGAALGRIAGVGIALVVVCVFLAITQPAFMTWDNWQNILRGQAVLATLAVGMTFVVITGGIDLGIASATALIVVVFGIAIEAWSWPVAVLAALLTGLVLGLINGLLIGMARIPFFVVTLGMLAIYQSWALLLSQTGAARSLLGLESFAPIGDFVNGSVGPIPTVVILVAAIYLVGSVVLAFTPFGRAVYAVGSNANAARLAGINVRGILVAVYTLAGLLAALGALIQAGRLSAAVPQADPNLMLNVVAAVLIGGVAFSGGDGHLIGTLVGVLFLGVIQNGLTLSGVSTFWQGTISGLILILAVAIGVVREYAPPIRQWLGHLPSRARA